MSYLVMLQVLAVSCAVLIAFSDSASAGYRPVEHKPLPAGCIAVDKPGSYGEPGKTYVLTRDISSPTSAIFLGKDVTLDLNGYSITYADGPYEHVPNYGFEQGLADWDMSKAPTARVEDTDKVKPFIGKKILRLSAGEQIVSPYITLPVANRTYYAMCGVLDWKMRITVFVEDQDGKTVRLAYGKGKRRRLICPQRGKTRLGGGFVFAWLHGLPAGKYRLRILAGTDCLIDEADIRPAMDVGVGIVDEIQPDASYRHIYEGIAQAAFPDYLKAGTKDQPIDSIPRASGKGRVTIRNGVIKSGSKAIRSWGIQSTANGVMLRIDNVKIVASGINTQAVSCHNARISNCRFEIDTPFIIQRHRLVDSPVSLVRASGAEVANSEFIGGQGCLYINGKNVQVHDNLFVNRQTVTNHYSVMLGGSSGVKIYRNRFEPEIGSGLTIFGSRDNEVYDNTFRIVAANGNCEYTNEDYSTNAIRITDYNTRDPRRFGGGNNIHHNKFHIVGKFYTNYKGNIPIATALFVSVGGGANFIHDNDIVVDDQSLGSPNQTCAMYIGGSRTGGEYYNNRITTNVPAFWIATPYGNASDVLVKNNTIIKAADAPADFKPFRLGYGRFVATDITFEGNKFVGCEFGIDATDADHTYTRK